MTSHNEDRIVAFLDLMEDMWDVVFEVKRKLVVLRSSRDPQSDLLRRTVGNWNIIDTKV